MTKNVHKFGLCAPVAAGCRAARRNTRQNAATAGPIAWSNLCGTWGEGQAIGTMQRALQ